MTKQVTITLSAKEAQILLGVLQHLPGTMHEAILHSTAKTFGGTEDTIDAIAGQLLFALLDERS